MNKSNIKIKGNKHFNSKPMKTLNPDDFAHVEFRFNKPKNKMKPLKKKKKTSSSTIIINIIFCIIALFACICAAIEKNNGWQ